MNIKTFDSIRPAHLVKQTATTTINPKRVNPVVSEVKVSSIPNYSELTTRKKRFFQKPTQPNLQIRNLKQAIIQLKTTIENSQNFIQSAQLVYTKLDALALQKNNLELLLIDPLEHFNSLQSEDYNYTVKQFARVCSSIEFFTNHLQQLEKGNTTIQQAVQKAITVYQSNICKNPFNSHYHQIAKTQLLPLIGSHGYKVTYHKLTNRFLYTDCSISGVNITNFQIDLTISKYITPAELLYIIKSDYALLMDCVNNNFKLETCEINTLLTHLIQHSKALLHYKYENYLPIVQQYAKLQQLKVHNSTDENTLQIHTKNYKKLSKELVSYKQDCIIVLSNLKNIGVSTHNFSRYNQSTQEYQTCFEINVNSKVFAQSLNSIPTVSKLTNEQKIIAYIDASQFDKLHTISALQILIDTQLQEYSSDDEQIYLQLHAGVYYPIEKLIIDSKNTIAIPQFVKNETGANIIQHLLSKLPTKYTYRRSEVGNGEIGFIQENNLLQNGSNTADKQDTTSQDQLELAVVSAEELRTPTNLDDVWVMQDLIDNFVTPFCKPNSYTTLSLVKDAWVSKTTKKINQNATTEYSICIPNGTFVNEHSAQITAHILNTIQTKNNTVGIHFYPIENIENQFKVDYLITKPKESQSFIRDTRSYLQDTINRHFLSF